MRWHLTYNKLPSFSNSTCRKLREMNKHRNTMITFTKPEVKKLDKLLEYLFKAQDAYGPTVRTEDIDFDVISVTFTELKNTLGLSDFELNKCLQVFYNREINPDKKFINVDHKDCRVWLMDLGIEFYYLGGFKRERKEQLTKRRFEIASIIFGIIASIGVIVSIYLSVHDSSRQDIRMDKIEMELNNSSKSLDKRVDEVEKVLKMESAHHNNKK